MMQNEADGIRGAPVWRRKMVLKNATEPYPQKEGISSMGAFEERHRLFDPAFLDCVKYGVPGMALE